MADGIDLDFDNGDGIQLYSPLHTSEALWMEVGDWGFHMDKTTVDAFTDLLNGLIREAFFTPQMFQLDAQEGLSMQVGVERAGVQLDLYQHGKHTGSGVTIPHSWVLRVTSAMEGLVAEAST